MALGGLAVHDGTASISFAEGGCCSGHSGHLTAPLRKLSSWSIERSTSCCCCANSGVAILRIGGEVWTVSLGDTPAAAQAHLGEVLHANALFDLAGTRNGAELALAGARSNGGSWDISSKADVCFDSAEVAVSLGPGSKVTVYKARSQSCGCSARQAIEGGFLGRLAFVEVRESAGCCSERTKVALGLGGAAPGGVVHFDLDTAAAQSLLREVERRSLHPALEPAELLHFAGAGGGGCCCASGVPPELAIRSASISLLQDRSGSGCFASESRNLWVPLANVVQVAVLGRTGCCAGNEGVLEITSASGAPKISMPLPVNDPQDSATLIARAIQSARIRNDMEIASGASKVGAARHSNAGERGSAQPYFSGGIAGASTSEEELGAATAPAVLPAHPPLQPAQASTPLLSRVGR
jgi:hypothetical protein